MGSGMWVRSRGEAGGVGRRGVQGVQVGMEIGCHMVGGDSGGSRVLGVGADQCWVPVNGKGFVLIDDQRALGAAAHTDST